MLVSSSQERGGDGGVWLRVKILNSLVLSLRTTVRAIRASLRDAAQVCSASLLIIGASSLNGPIGQPQLLGAMLESKGIDMNVEGKWAQLDAVSREVLARAWKAGAGPGGAPLTRYVTPVRNLTRFATAEPPLEMGHAVLDRAMVECGLALVTVQRHEGHESHTVCVAPHRLCG